jgi:hypothetical protein
VPLNPPARVVQIDGFSSRVPAEVSRPRTPADVSTSDLEHLFGQLAASFGNDFIAAKTLIAMLEVAASKMSALDRTQIARLMTSTGHSILLTVKG